MFIYFNAQVIEVNCKLEKKKKEDHVNLLWRKVDKWHYFQWQLSMS